jgi:hypothetical protein
VGYLRRSQATATAFSDFDFFSSEEIFFAGNGNETKVFDSNCVSLHRAVTQSGNTVTVTFDAPAAGTYFIALNFSAQSLINEPGPHPGTTVLYDFTATGVPDSTSGFDLVKH